MTIGLGLLAWQGRKVYSLYIVFEGRLNSLSDWQSNCQNLPPSEIQSPVMVAQGLARNLRIAEKCDFVIAITHMRLVEDLAVSVATLSGDEKVDLILGGHDHEVICRLAGDLNRDPSLMVEGRDDKSVVSQELVTSTKGKVRIVKSGTDWRSYSRVDLLVTRDSKGRAHLETIECK